MLVDLSESYRLAVITNGGGDIQSRRLAFSGLDRQVELLVTSSDVDVGKPDARIFEHALQRLGVSADEAWMVGDSLDSDVVRAAEAGITVPDLLRGSAASAACAVPCRSLTDERLVSW